MEKDRILKNAGMLQENEMNFHIDIPEEIKIINDAFIKNGKKIFLVGGCVRDSLLGIKPKDWDITTELMPKEVKEILDNSNIYNFPKGEAFNVISAVVNNQEFEIATFRSESYENGDGRRPTSVGKADIRLDAQRRDLKINALYYDLKEGKVLDFTGGLEDLKNKRVSTVGNPIDRFDEDKLRVLRFIRFSNRFGSQLDAETIKAINHFKDLSGVSNERIRAEFLSGLKSSIYPEKFLDDYRNFGFFNRMFPNLKFNFKFIKDLKDPILALSNLLINNNIKDVIKALTKFTASGEEKNNIEFLISLDLFFNGFDKLTFVPEIDGKKLFNLILVRKTKNSNLTNEQILKWTEIRNINNNLIKNFLNYEPKFKAVDFPNLTQGKELGDAITKINAEDFLKKI